MEHDVFISYSSKNKPIADAVCHELEAHNIRCWIAPRDVTPGAEYADLIDDAITNAKVVVVLFSESASISSWVKGEINVAFSLQKIIIPFRLDETPLKGQNRVLLSQKHWIDAFPDYKDKIKDLVDAVTKVLGKIPTETITTYKPKSSPTKPRKNILYLILALILCTITIIIISQCPSSNHYSTVSENTQEKAKQFFYDKAVQEEVLSHTHDFSYLSADLITQDNIKNKSKFEIKLMRNAIYAMHGYVFKDDYLYDYFRKYDWYNPRVTDISQIQSALNDIEKQNVTFLKNHE